MPSAPYDIAIRSRLFAYRLQSMKGRLMCFWLMKKLCTESTDMESSY